MIFKSEVDGGYKAGFFFFTLFSVGFVYGAITSFSVGTCILAAAFVLMQLFVLLPMYLNTRYILEDEGIRIRVGIIANRFFSYESIFGFQRVTSDAKGNYGLSGRKKIAIFYRGFEEDYEAITISPKRDEEFVAAFTEKTGIEITPPARTFREIQDEYNTKTSDEQRRAARRRLAAALRGNYNETLAAESPESLQQHKEEYEKELAAEQEAARAFEEMSEEEREAQLAREKKASFFGKKKEDKAHQDANAKREGEILLRKLDSMRQELGVEENTAAEEEQPCTDEESPKQL